MILRTAPGNTTSLPAEFRPDRSEIGRVLRFVIIGCASTAIDYGTYQLFLLAVTPITAKGVSYLAGTLFGFVGNKLWTFGSRRPSLAEPMIYLALYAVTMGANVAVNAAVLAAWADGSNFAFLAATSVSMISNYLGLRFLAFRRAVSERERAAPQAT
jgi:putative flippase GtrA